jgi:hypothetical protein
MALYLLLQFLHSLSHHSLHATKSYAKVPKRWRCICSRNSSTASLPTPCKQHSPLRKSQKDGAVSALAIPLQPHSPLPASNAILYESLKKMALNLLTKFLYSLSHYSLHATQSFTKVSKRWRCICSRNSSTAFLTSHHSLHATLSFVEVLKRWRCICSHNSSTASLTTPARNTILYESVKKMALKSEFALAIPPQPL